MTGTGDARHAPFAFLIEDVACQRAVARALLAEAEDVAKLLGSETAALGSVEIAFLARLRADLLTRARALGENATRTAARAAQALRSDQE